MKELSQVTALVFDHGLFLPLAQKLGQQLGRVLYQTPWEKGFPTLNDCIIGDGYMNVERCNDFWTRLDEIDLFVFPDIQHSGIQAALESIGRPVWGSRSADEIEMNRVKFLSTLQELKLPAPKWKPVRGLTNLRDHLRDQKDKFIKISRYRGSMETWHWRDWASDEGHLDQLAVTFGPAKDRIMFMVFEPIDADIEVGYDGYCIDGQFPSVGIQGYESKDRGFLCRAQPYDKLPEQVREVNEAFAPILGKYRYRNFWSTEIRINGDEAIFIDPCCRCPSPSTECQLALYENIGEIIWQGAHGNLVEPKLAAPFAGSAVMTIKEDRKDWISVNFPDELREHIACGCSCQIGEIIAFPPGEDKGPELGWLCATGHTPGEVIKNLLNLAKLVPDGIEVHTESLADLIKQIVIAQEEGIQFAKQMPDPGIVVKS